MAKKKETDGIPMLMEAPSTGLTVPTSFKIGDTQVNKDALEKRIAEDTKHTIAGVNDTAGYKSAIAFRASYRTTRTTLAKVVKEMAQPHKDYVAGLKKASDEIGAIAFKGEQYFDELITAIDDEKQRIKDEAEKEAQRKLQGRINELTALDAKFDGEMYHFDFDEGLFVSAFLLKDYSDVEFAEILSDIQAAHQVEQQRLADEKVRLEEEAKQKRLADIAIAEQAEKNEQVSTELNLKRNKLRIKEISMLGFTWNESDELYIHGSLPVTISIDEVKDCDDDRWEEWMYDLENFVPAVEPLVDYHATEPIADVQGAETSNQVTEDQWTEEYTGTQGNDVVDANNVIIESDYSLNEFEKFIQQSFKGTEKVKQQFLLAISEYKGLMDKM